MKMWGSAAKPAVSASRAGAVAASARTLHGTAALTRPYAAMKHSGVAPMFDQAQRTGGGPAQKLLDLLHIRAVWIDCGEISGERLRSVCHCVPSWVPPVTPIARIDAIPG